MGDADLYATTGPGVSRRGFMKLGAAGTVGAVGLGGGGTYLPGAVEESEAVVCGGICIGAGIGLTAAAGVAVGAYAGQKLAEHFADSEDLTGYTGSDALHSSIESKALELATANEQILSSLENTAEYADNAALPKGMTAVVDAYNNGKEQAQISTEMESAIDQYYAGVQEDILNAYSSAYQQVQSWYDALDAHTAADGDTEIVPYDVLVSDVANDGWSYTNDIEIDTYFNRDDSGTDYASAETYDITLADGSTKTVEVVRNTGSSGGELYPHTQMDLSWSGRLGVIPQEFRNDIESAVPDDVIVPLDTGRFQGVWAALTESRDRVYDNLSSFINDVMSQYEPGEIDLSNAVGPVTAHTELRTEDDSLAFAGAAASMLGIPRTEDDMEITLHDDGQQVTGGIYASASPEGGFSVGTQYDPSNLDYTVFLRYQYEDENGEMTADFAEINQPFTIDKATDADGNAVDSVNTEEGPTYDTSDISDLQNQLEQVYEVQQQMLADQEEEAEPGGAGGFLSGVDSSTGMVLAVAAGAVALFGLQGDN